MEEGLVYFVNGKIVLIVRDEGERSLHYFIRVKFILDQPLVKIDDQVLPMQPRYEVYDMQLLESYSRIYVNKVFFGTTYPPEIERRLQAILDYEDATVLPEEKLEVREFKATVEGNTIEYGNADEIVLETESTITLESEDAEFQRASGEPIEEIYDAAIVDVVIEPPTPESTTQGVTMNIITDEAEEDKIIACADEDCEEPATTTLTTSAGTKIIIEPLEVSDAPPAEASQLLQEVQRSPFEQQETQLEGEAAVRSPLPPVEFLNADEEQHGYLALEYLTQIVIDEDIYSSALHYFAVREASYFGNEKLNDIKQEVNQGRLKRIVSTLLTEEETATWNEVKDEIMFECNLAKFQQNPELQQKLIATNSAEIIYNNNNNNYWGKTWGTLDNNLLGKVLMRVRVALQEQKGSEEPLVLEVPAVLEEPEIEQTPVEPEVTAAKSAAEIRELLKAQEVKKVTLKDGTTATVVSDRSETMALLDTGIRVSYEEIVRINDIEL